MAITGLDRAAGPAAAVSSPRFFVVGYLPTVAAVLYILILMWSGAPSAHVSFQRAWATGGRLGTAEVVAIGLTITVMAVLAQPLQLPLVRLLEGDWPRRLGGRRLRERQLGRKRRLAQAAEIARGASAEAIQAAGVAGAELRRRFPLEDRFVRPTALGNALRAAEDLAGRDYGWDSVVAWSRLYAVLDERMKSIVDSRRDALDMCARTAVTSLAAAIVSAGLLAPAGWWPLLAAAPLAIAVVAYLAAVHAAFVYGESVAVAFDLRRFELLEALHLELPDDAATEKALAKALSDQWRQAVPFPAHYKHS